jgi:HSP20 family protein
MGQLLNMAFGDMPFGQMQVMNAPWVPLADVSESDDAYTVEVELPGVRKDQLNVELNDRELVINGEIPEPEEEDGGQRRRRSRRTGRFEFRTVLPGEVNPDGVSANLSDGVLSVKIPKAEEAKPRRIEVTA